MADVQEVFGVEVVGPHEEWRVIKVIGSAVCIDSDGRMQSWHFESDNLPNWEALGLLRESLVIREDATPYVYWDEDDTEDWEDEEAA